MALNVAVAMAAALAATSAAKGHDGSGAPRRRLCPRRYGVASIVLGPTAAARTEARTATVTMARTAVKTAAAVVAAIASQPILQ